MNLSSFKNNVDPFKTEHAIAVALSGGADSMALTALLSAWCAAHAVKLHILHVDHGLRAESKIESAVIKSWVKNIPYAAFKILPWVHKTKITHKIQEQARDARYALMAKYCHTHKINYLCVAHHKDDQAETILFRLAKGSGLDGMTGIKQSQIYDDHLTILRPLLSYTHADLISYCKNQKLNWLEDPSNTSDKFARARLRNSRDILAAEGLTTDRLNQFALRCARARVALNFAADEFITRTKMPMSKNEIAFPLANIQKCPNEILIRILQKSINEIQGKRKYPPSLEQLEIIAEKILEKTNGRATLAHCLISWSKTKKKLTITRE